MDRTTLSRILLAVGVFFLVFTLFGKGCNKDKGPNTWMVAESFDVLPLPEGVKQGDPCIIDTPTFKAVVAPTAGGLLSYELHGQKYVEAGKPIDVARRTTIDSTGKPIFDYAPLRANFRNHKDESQVPGDNVAFTVRKEGDTCVLEHVTKDVVSIKRTVKPTPRQYELQIDTTITNLAPAKKTHAFSTSLFALQFKSQEGGFLSRPSPNDIFTAACSASGKVERMDKGKLREWIIRQGPVDFTGISSSYIGQAVVPVAPAADAPGAVAPNSARCALIAQDRGNAGTESEQSLFRSVLAYPAKDLDPNQSATYSQIAFIGPKERGLLAAAAGGRNLDQLVDLGFFSIIAKVLVRFLAFVHGLVGSWGIAIILLTVTVRLALMPLTLPQIRSSISMRRLKPELDALNKKFEHDAQAKMLATSQLYKKHGVNPLAGCLPAVLQMPVWFALYTALQTAMELYHEKFLFWSDLSSPDPRFILPLVLGATMFVQQKVTPMQMDPAQQKVFLYFMPAMFTVFMLFLPAGLGVYMLTNSLLGIVQTIAVERYMKSTEPVGGGDVKVVEVKESDEKPKKGKTSRELARRPRGGDEVS